MLRSIFAQRTGQAIPGRRMHCTGAQVSSYLYRIARPSDCCRRYWTERNKQSHLTNPIDTMRYIKTSMPTNTEYWGGNEIYLTECRDAVLNSIHPTIEQSSKRNSRKDIPTFVCRSLSIDDRRSAESLFADVSMNNPRDACIRDVFAEYLCSAGYIDDMLGIARIQLHNNVWLGSNVFTSLIRYYGKGMQCDRMREILNLESAELKRNNFLRYQIRQLSAASFVPSFVPSPLPKATAVTENDARNDAATPLLSSPSSAAAAAAAAAINLSTTASLTAKTPSLEDIKNLIPFEGMRVGPDLHTYYEYAVALLHYALYLKKQQYIGVRSTRKITTISTSAIDATPSASALKVYTGNSSNKRTAAKTGGGDDGDPFFATELKNVSEHAWGLLYRMKDHQTNPDMDLIFCLLQIAEVLNNTKLAEHLLKLTHQLAELSEMDLLVKNTRYSWQISPLTSASSSPYHTGLESWTGEGGGRGVYDRSRPIVSSPTMNHIVQITDRVVKMVFKSRHPAVLHEIVGDALERGIMLHPTTVAMCMKSCVAGKQYELVLEQFENLARKNVKRDYLHAFLMMEALVGLERIDDAWETLQILYGTSRSGGVGVGGAATSPTPTPTTTTTTATTSKGSNSNSNSHIRSNGSNNISLGAYQLHSLGVLQQAIIEQKLLCNTRDGVNSHRGENRNSGQGFIKGFSGRSWDRDDRSHSNNNSSSSSKYYNTAAEKHSRRYEADIDTLQLQSKEEQLEWIRAVTFIANIIIDTSSSVQNSNSYNISNNNKTANAGDDQHIKSTRRKHAAYASAATKAELQMLNRIKKFGEEASQDLLTTVLHVLRINGNARTVEAVGDILGPYEVHT